MSASVITSRHNEQVKLARRLHHKKHRDKHGLFFLEGVRIVEEALSFGLVRSLFYTERLTSAARGVQLLGRGQELGIPVWQCSEAVFDYMADTVQSQGVAAVVSKPSWPSVPREGLWLVADEIQDPGNMGALIRTAVGAGVRGLLIVQGSVDLYNPKVLRSTMGAIFHLPHWCLGRNEIIASFKESGSTLAVADLTKAKNYWAVAYPPNLAVIVGNEARGIHPSFLEHADLRVRIPLAGPIESLNVSNAAAVLLYEIFRQRHCNNCDSVI